MTDEMVLLRDIKSKLELLEDHNIKNTLKNTWDIKDRADLNKYSIDSLFEYIKTIPDFEYENFSIINGNIEKVLKYLGDNFNLKDSRDEKIKDMVKEKLQELKELNTSPESINVVTDLMRLVDML